MTYPPQEPPQPWQPNPAWPAPGQPGYYQQPYNPYQQPRPKKTPKWPWIVGAVAALIVIIIIAAVAGSGGKKRNKAATTVTTTQQTASQSTTAVAPTTSSAPTPTPTPSPTQTKFPVGTAVPLVQDNDDGPPGKATVTVISVKLGQQSSNEFEKPQNGQYAVADISITDQSGNFDYNPLDFTISTPDLRSWQATIVAGFDPGLNSGTLTTGQAIRGYVEFDIEPGPITGLNIGSGAFGSSVIATWTPV